MGALSIDREIAQLRNQPRLNFLAMALTKVQLAHNQLLEQMATASKAAPAASASSSSAAAAAASASPIVAGVTSLNGGVGALSLVGGAGISIFPSGPNIGISANGCLESIGFAPGTVTVFGNSVYPSTASVSILPGGAIKIFLAYRKSATANTIALLLSTDATHGYQVSDTGAGSLALYAYTPSGYSAALASASVPNYVGWGLLEMILVADATPSNTLWATKDGNSSGYAVDASVPMTGVALSLGVLIDSAANIGDCQVMII
jgi:hypothetical protein